MFEGFSRTAIEASGTTIHLRHGGSGPPLLLLHGFPETHVMWHAVAPLLAERFTVVCADLRGHGDSSKPLGVGNYAKSLMARDQIEVMRALGFERFGLAGHDRGGRVAHRLALDFPERVERLALLDIGPMARALDALDAAAARDNYHWFFLAQPNPLPERLLEADPGYYLRWHLRSWSGGGRRVLRPGGPRRVRALFQRSRHDPRDV